MVCGGLGLIPKKGERGLVCVVFLGGCSAAAAAAEQKTFRHVARENYY